MKKSILHLYFNGGQFMNHVIAAGFRARKEWELGDMLLLVAKVSIALKAPKMTGVADQLERWVECGLAVLEERGDQHFLKPGKTVDGVDVREAGVIPAEIIDAIGPAIESLRRYKKCLAECQIP